MLRDNPVLMQLKKQINYKRNESGRHLTEEDSNTISKRNSGNAHGNFYHDHAHHMDDRKGNDQFRSCDGRSSSTNRSSSNYATSSTSGELKEGIVKATDKSYGFLEVDVRESYFLPPPAMRNLIGGDKISARIISNGDRSQAEPVSLIEQGLTRFVARVRYMHGILNVVPDRPNIRNIIKARNTVSGVELQEGDWVIANLVQHAMNGRGGHMAEIIEFVAKNGDPEAPWWVVLRGLDLPTASPEDTGNYPFHDEALPRSDLTALPFVTIDSDTTKDMDDALYIEKQDDGNMKLWVAIADPTGYIAETDPLESVAIKRAFSIYLPGRDIPMLPRTLCEDKCSLWAGKVKKALVGSFTIAPDGEIQKDIKFELADVISQGKLVYDEISDLLESKETTFHPNDVVLNQLKLLEEFCHIRYQYRSIHSSVFRDKPDYEFILNDDGSLKEIKIAERRIANRIVEESMIAANACAGEFLAKHFNAGIFNIHKGFDDEKIGDAIEFLKESGCPIVDETELKTVEGFSKVKRWIDKSGSNYLDSRLRKYQAYAEISPIPDHHFGLGLDYYATWTSPIRKYGDMINHRLIKACITNCPHPSIPDDKTIEAMNVARRSNRIAERNVRDWLYVKYLEKYMKDRTIFQGEIFDISRGGMRVHLAENGAMAFIPASFICSDRKRLTCDNPTGRIYLDGKVIFELGQIVPVRVAELNYETRSIVADLVDKPV